MDTEYTSPIIEEFDDPTDTFKDLLIKVKSQNKKIR